MPPRILLTTTSYQDTPGPHHDRLASQGYEMVCERGPLSEGRMLELAGDFDGFLCGDDAITREVLEKSLPRLRVISKYGIGLDKIDLAATRELGVPVLFTPGVNHTTVAEHTFCLLLASQRNLLAATDATRAGQWKRPTGHELWRKKIGVIGLGRIGQEMIKRCLGFEMEVHAFGNFWPGDFAARHPMTRHASIESLCAAVDILSLHTKLEASTHHLIDARRLALLPKGAVLVNTSRAELVDTAAVLAALDSGPLAAYATDVMDQEPPLPNHPLLRHPKAIVTPHIGSRTFESVPRQALMATDNLIHFLQGHGEYSQANA
ncbi:MAG: phosphoglycerate dehydrogenase [Verrucomicrobiales bacterium]